jgi:hypothetical protein
MEVENGGWGREAREECSEPDRCLYTMLHRRMQLRLGLRSAVTIDVDLEPFISHC